MGTERESDATEVQKRADETVSEAKSAASDVETDRRGVVLPARSRVGGIITPQ